MDGLNVARAGCTHCRGPSGVAAAGDARNLIQAIEQLGAYAVLPTWALKDSKIRNYQELQQFVRRGQVIIVPQGKHDDKFLLEMALRKGGIVLSNDHFLEHVRSGLVTADWLKAYRRGMRCCDGKFTVLSHEETQEQNAHTTGKELMLVSARTGISTDKVDRVLRIRKEVRKLCARQQRGEVRWASDARALSQKTGIPEMAIRQIMQARRQVRREQKRFHTEAFRASRERSLEASLDSSTIVDSGDHSDVDEW